MRNYENPKIRIKSEKNMMKIRRFRLNPKKRQKSEKAWGKCYYLTICTYIEHSEPSGKMQMARDRNSLSNPAYSRPGLPHNLETIVFLLLGDYFPFTHCKHTEQSSGVKTLIRFHWLYLWNKIE